MVQGCLLVAVSHALRAIIPVMTFLASLACLILRTSATSMGNGFRLLLNGGQYRIATAKRIINGCYKQNLEKSHHEHTKTVLEPSGVDFIPKALK